MPKRNLVLAEDCAGLGPLKESCKLPDWFVAFDLLFSYLHFALNPDTPICLLWYGNINCRKSTKACRPTKSCILRLGERPKAPRAFEQDLQAGVGFERCYEKKGYPVHLVFHLIWIHVWKQDRQTWLNYVAARPLTVSEESVNWLTSLVLAARASLFPPSGIARGRRTQEPKCLKECLCFQLSISQSDHSQFHRFFIPQLDLSPKVAILGGKAHTSLATGYVCVREQQVLDQQEACQILQEASRKAPWHS